MLLELMLTEGFMSNPDQPGVEKLHVCKIPAEFLDAAYTELPSLDGAWQSFSITRLFQDR